ncbi:MAG: hypothetical protein FWH07_06375 [Oscillospiraceae bacterium]|nr:hypothetical protein [Oscillospiraceae bacterium]
MAYETKVLLSLLGDVTVKAESTEEVYLSIQKMANVEGVFMKPFDEAKKELSAARQKKSEK